MVNQKLHTVWVTRFQSITKLTKLTWTKLLGNENVKTSVQSNTMGKFNGNYE